MTPLPGGRLTSSSPPYLPHEHMSVPGLGGLVPRHTPDTLRPPLTAGESVCRDHTGPGFNCIAESQMLRMDY